VYYCDESYQERATEISDSGLGAIRRMSEELGIEWEYRPLHWHLERARAEGQVTFPDESS
jgi:hypothetical protein